MFDSLVEPQVLMAAEGIRQACNDLGSLVAGNIQVSARERRYQRSGVADTGVGWLAITCLTK
jgi:hypothetical protein